MGVVRGTVLVAGCTHCLAVLACAPCPLVRPSRLVWYSVSHARLVDGRNWPFIATVSLLLLLLERGHFLPSRPLHSTPRLPAVHLIQLEFTHARPLCLSLSSGT